MKLYLIRHAQSTNNLLYARNGNYNGSVPDPRLTELGQEQARRVAQLLADEAGEPRKNPRYQRTGMGFGLTHLYCSLMTRAIETALPIAEACGLKLVGLDNTFERGGLYKRDEEHNRVSLPGPTRQEFMARFPKLILPESVNDQGWYHQPFETESMFVKRMKKAVPQLVNRHLGTNDCVGLVAHGHFLDQLMNELMGTERRLNNYHPSGFQINWVFNNVSVSRIDFATGSPIVIYLNRIDHLSNELITM